MKEVDIIIMGVLGNNLKKIFIDERFRNFNKTTLNLLKQYLIKEQINIKSNR